MAGRWLAIMAGLLACGCTLVRMEGFDAVAATGDRVDIQGIPMFMNGHFRIGADGTRGHVRRIAGGASELSEATDPDRPRTEAGRVARGGRIAFEVAGPSVQGRLAATCRYHREEARMRGGPVEIAEPTVPLDLFCDFARDGRPVGTMELGAIPPRSGLVATAPRAGRVRMDGVALTLVSIHDGAGTRWPNEGALGYLLEAEDGRTIAAVEVNGVTSRRLVLPRDPAERQAALAAGIALALFQDPGDTD